MGQTDTFDQDFFDAPEEEASGDVKAQIANMVRQLRNLQNERAELEMKVSNLKAQEAELEMKKIPDALLSAGLTEIRTVDGLKVTTKLFVGAIPREKKGEVFAWLDHSGFGSIIKRQVSVAFDKGSTEAARQAEEAIKALGLDPKMTLDVHHQTWASFAKEQVGKGKQLPFDAWGVYYGQKATISEK